MRATALRVLQQLRRDPRTVGLLLVVPCVLLALVRFLVNDDGPVFDRFGVPLVGVFPLTSMFLVTSVTMLRERTTGTLERLLTLPVSKIDVLGGYAVAFGAVALVQSVVVSIVGVGLLGLDAERSLGWLVVVALANALLGMASGLFLSAFAATEFQAVQFLPAFLLPQLLLCGLAVPRDRMSDALRWVASVLPLSFAYDALDGVRTGGAVLGPLLVVVAFLLAAIVAGAATLRRRTA